MSRAMVPVIFLLAACGPGGSSPSGDKAKSPDPKSTDAGEQSVPRLEAVSEKIAGSQLMRPLLQTVFDPKAGTVGRPSSGGLGPNASDGSRSLSPAERKSFEANQEKAAKQLAQHGHWMLRHLDTVLSRSKKPVTDDARAELLTGSECGLTEEEARLFLKACQGGFNPDVRAKSGEVKPGSGSGRRNR